MNRSVAGGGSLNRSRRRHNGWRTVATVAFLTFALVLGGLLAQRAAASPAQRLADGTAAWVERTLQVPVERRPLMADTLRFPTAAAFVRCGEPVVYARPWVLDELAGMDRRRTFDPAVAALLIHETLHRSDCSRFAGEADVRLEEWAVDALAHDLLAAWTARFAPWVAGIGLRVTPSYAEGVAAVRAASRYATGSASWRTRAARLWRRELVTADVETRRAMVAEAERRAGR